MDDMAAVSNGDAVRAAVAARTHPGQRRSENQDNFLVSDLSGDASGVLLRPAAEESGAAASRLSPGERGLLLMVADGMGGAAAGRLASGLACTFVLAELREAWCPDPVRSRERFATRLREAIEAANRRVHDHARRNPDCAGMGTTVTVAGIFDHVACMAQVGDSRAYLVRSGVATQLTRDQSVVQKLLDAGVLTSEEAERSPQGHLVLQAVGVEPEVSVDVTLQELRRGDTLVLCSDGLYRLVTPREIAEVVGRSDDPERASAELVTLANQRGGPDNVTVVIARLDAVDP